MNQQKDKKQVNFQPVILGNQTHQVPSARQQHKLHMQSEIQPGSSAARHVQTLPKDVFMEMLRLEEKILFGEGEQEFGNDDITQIVELYAQCVEYYDSVKDPIKDYFLEKIQMTVTSNSVLKMMHEKKRMLRESISRIRNSMSQQQFSKMVNEDDYFEQETSKTNQLFPNDYNKTRTQYKNAMKGKEVKTNKYSISRKKKERSQKLQLAYEQQEFNKNNDSVAIIAQQEKVSVLIQEIIQDDIQKQENDILEKIKIRKYKKNLQSSRKKAEESKQAETPQVEDFTNNQEIEQQEDMTFQQFNTNQEMDPSTKPKVSYIFDAEDQEVQLIEDEGYSPQRESQQHVSEIDNEEL